MRDSVRISRKKTGLSNITAPSLVSPDIPTLASPIRGFTPEINTSIIQTLPEVLSQTQSTDEQVLEPEALKQRPLGHDISRISLRPQAKLNVSQPGDMYEQEADMMASRVMSMSLPTVQREPMLEEEEEEVKSLPLNASIQRYILREEVQTERSLQFKTDRSFQSGGNIESQLNSSKGGGSPLGNDVRGFMEPRFGADFSQVRVHTGGDAVQMNRELGAQAFAHGSDIYFGALKSPGNNELTAHELTHVLQQTGNLQRYSNLGVTHVGNNYVQCDNLEPETPSYRPDIHHDHGFLDDGHGNIDETKRREPTLSDYAALAWWKAKLNGAEILRPDLIDATAAYRHFLFGNGATRTIDYERFIANDPSGQIIITSAVNDIVDLAREQHNQFLQTHPDSNEAQTFNVHTDAIPVGSTEYYPYPKTENWQKAIGAHIIWLEASVTVNINAANNTRSFKIEMTLHMEDMYNFNPGATDIATGAPDSDNGRFEVTGLGHEYLNTAIVNRTIISPPEPMNTTSSDSSNPSVDGPRIPPVRTPDDGRGTGSR